TGATRGGPCGGTDPRSLPAGAGGDKGSAATPLDKTPAGADHSAAAGRCPKPGGSSVTQAARHPGATPGVCPEIARLRPRRTVRSNPRPASAHETVGPPRRTLHTRPRHAEQGPPVPGPELGRGDPVADRLGEGSRAQP